MEEMFKEFAGKIALAVEMVAALIIAYGALEAIIKLLIPRSRSETALPFSKRKEIFLRFGVWMLLGLEFELGADIVRSAISPTWTDIGQLGAIAVIRTFLNYFLEKDVEDLVEPRTAVKEL